MTSDEGSTDEISSDLEETSITAKKLIWSGNAEELKWCVRNLLITDCEVNEDNVSSSFRCMPLTVTLYDDKTVKFQGENKKKIRKLKSSIPGLVHCEAGCCEIYESESRHITQRVGKEPILGDPHQFCAAFYHTYEWGNRKHHCLDEENCIISKRVKEESKGKKKMPWNLQPITVAAFVKFKNDEGHVVYEAKYTNCRHKKKHAEDFFKEDVERGILKKKVDENPKGTITMYLTLQPCNESTSAEGTTGTWPNHSCCKTLKNIFETLKKNGKSISLRIKVTHPNHLSTSKEKKPNHEELRQNAVRGIKDLMNAGVQVSAMDREDWGYLFSMTVNQSRDELDHEIRGVLQKISDTAKETLPSP